MSSSSKHLMHFEGGNALSLFRAAALLPTLQAICPRIVDVAARHVHWVWSDGALGATEVGKLAALLNYGDAYAGPTQADAGTELIVVMPRLGLQGHGHRPQLRLGHPPRRARHRSAPDAEDRRRGRLH